MEMMLTKQFGGQTAAINVAIHGDLNLAVVRRINGVTDTDLVKYDTTADRDAAFERVVGDMVAAGYTCTQVGD